MMNEDELKSLYRESSTEVPDSRVDDLILAQAAEALEEKSAKADTWRPYLCLLYTSPSPRDRTRSRMPSSA